MTKREKEKLLTGVARYAIQELDRAAARGWEPVGTCIGTSRLIVNALATAGVRATAVPVSVKVTNAAYREGEAEGIFGADVGDDVRQAYMDRGAYSVWIGRDLSAYDPATFYARDLRDGLRGWDGHVVVVADGYMIDATLYQTIRATLDPPPAIVLPGAGRRLTLGEPVRYECEDEHGTHVEWDRIADRGFLSAPDWVEFPPHHPRSREWTRAALAEAQ